jgi:hypothetical protein
MAAAELSLPHAAAHKLSYQLPKLNSRALAAYRYLRFSVHALASAQTFAVYTGALLQTLTDDWENNPRTKPLAEETGGSSRAEFRMKVISEET